MSLALVQDYSSDEEVEEGQRWPSDSGGSDEEAAPPRPEVTVEPPVPPRPETPSSLPSPAHLFAEVTGPPEYLKFAATGPLSRPVVRRSPQDAQIVAAPALNGQDRKPPSSGAVLEAKPRSLDEADKETSASPEVGRKVSGANLPPPEEAASLLRMCLKCGVPKTFSNTIGMVCPMCNDRPEAGADPDRKKRSLVKDKEKSKRMKGQSSHASWKSETEMQLRQQFD